MENNCALFLPTLLFSGPVYPMVSLKIFSCRPPFLWQQFWNKIDYNSALTKDNFTLFSPTPYFRARTIQWYHVNFSPKDFCCHDNQPFLFKHKIGCRLTRTLNAETLLLIYDGLAMGQIPRFTERISSFEKNLSERIMTRLTS